MWTCSSRDNGSLANQDTIRIFRLAASEAGVRLSTVCVYPIGTAGHLQGRFASCASSAEAWNSLSSLANSARSVKKKQAIYQQ